MPETEGFPSLFLWMKRHLASALVPRLVIDACGFPCMCLASGWPMVQLAGGELKGTQWVPLYWNQFHDYKYPSFQPFSLPLLPLPLTFLHLPHFPTSSPFYLSFSLIKAPLDPRSGRFVGSGVRKKKRGQSRKWQNARVFSFGAPGHQPTWVFK